MLTVSKEAKEEIKEFFKKNKDRSPIRIVESRGCCGASLGMALDEPKTGDEIIKDDGITFVVAKQLFKRVKPIRIDFIVSRRGTGFSVSGNLRKAGRC